MLSHSRLRILFLNVGHFIDHFMLLIFATVVLKLTLEWDLSYAELVPYATPGFIAFGVFTIPAGWLADRWSREGMMVIFFIGIGLCAIFAGFATSPMMLAFSLTCLGVFAAIYHPVGLAMVVEGLDKTGVPLAINGLWGNMGVATAALLSGFIIESWRWQAAFYLPGMISVLIGFLFLWFIKSGDQNGRQAPIAVGVTPQASISRRVLIRAFTVILTTTAIGGFVFQSTTFALPKVLSERLSEVATSTSEIGVIAFFIFSLAALSQLLVGYLVDRVSIRWVFGVVALLQSTLFLLMINQSGWAAFVVAVAFMFVVFGQIPINDVLVGRIAKSAWRSRAFALRYLVTFSVAATALPLIAWIHGNLGFDALFMLLALAAGLILVTVMFLPSTKKLAGAN